MNKKYIYQKNSQSNYLKNTTNYNLTIAIYNNKLKISNKINKQTKYYKNKYLIK